jgi:hypothetical protein
MCQVHISRVVVISEVDAQHCRHTITGGVHVSIPAVGRLVEKYVMENTVAAMNLLDTVVDRCAPDQAPHMTPACMLRKEGASASSMHAPRPL